MADIGTAPVWAAHRELASRHGFNGCWSAPIRDADERVLGAFAAYLVDENTALTQHLDLFDRMIRLAGIAIARKRDERALRQSEQRYRGLFENVIEGVYRATAEGRIEANGSVELCVAFSVRRPGPLDAALEVEPMVGKPLRLPVRANAVVPDVQVAQAAMAVGDAYIGSAARVPLTLHNPSSVGATLVCDLWEHPEFAIHLPRSAWNLSSTPTVPTASTARSVSVELRLAAISGSSSKLRRASR
jgi:hypothetical protein